jgi:hypothetical protein
MIQPDWLNSDQTVKETECALSAGFVHLFLVVRIDRDAMAAVDAGYWHNLQLPLIAIQIGQHTSRTLSKDPLVLCVSSSLAYIQQVISL